MIFFSISILVSSAYAMRTISTLFTGPIKPQMQQIQDLRTSEILAAGLLVAGIVLFGLLPALLTDLSSATITQMSSLINQRFQLD
jgi:NADH-quinone oxidoreductase subunit M